MELCKRLEYAVFRRFYRMRVDKLLAFVSEQFAARDQLSYQHLYVGGRHAERLG